MEKRREASPVYARQNSMSGSSAGTPSSPMMSPMNRHVRSGSAGVVNFRRQQNTAARAAAQRLARVMAHQQADDESSEDEDLNLPPPIVFSSPRRANRSPSPAIGRYLTDQSSVQSTSTGRPSILMKPTPMIPPIKPSPKSVATLLLSESPVVSRREKRMSLDWGNSSMRDNVHSRSSSTLQDEIDVLQEENENILEKLRLTEERCEEAEARAKQLEKQVASLGEGVSLEARLLSRKEAALQQREVPLLKHRIDATHGSITIDDECATLRAAAVQRTVSKDEEIIALQMEAKSAKDKVTSVVEHLLEAESEIKSLRTAAQQMILNQEEMEEVVLKRCWLARYWKLCVQHGIHSDIAEAKYEYWSSFAPLPLEAVVSAGQKAREASLSADRADANKDRVTLGITDLYGEENIEGMLLVEKGLRELISLKVEEAVLLAMAKKRCSNIKGPMFLLDGSNVNEAFALSPEECEDVQFKQAWLVYIWRRVCNHGLEEDIAEDRLQFWIDRSTHPPNSQDTNEVDRGFLELKKLGIESQLWEACRKGVNEDFSHRESSTPSEI